MPEPAGHARQRIELRVEVGEQAVRLEPPFGLDHHHVEGLLLHQRDRIQLGREDARDRVRLCERLSDEGEARRQGNVVLERDPLQIGERLACADARERPPVEARELATHLVHERRLIGVPARQRQREDQIGDVVCAVLRKGEEQQGQALTCELHFPGFPFERRESFCAL